MIPVKDVNDNPPVFHNRPYLINISEATPVGSEIEVSNGNMSLSYVGCVIQIITCSVIIILDHNKDIVEREKKTNKPIITKPGLYTLKHPLNILPKTDESLHYYNHNFISLHFETRNITVIIMTLLKIIGESEHNSD